MGVNNTVIMTILYYKMTELLSKILFFTRPTSFQRKCFVYLVKSIWCLISLCPDIGLYFAIFNKFIKIFIINMLRNISVICLDDSLFVWMILYLSGWSFISYVWMILYLSGWSFIIYVCMILNLYGWSFISLDDPNLFRW